MLMERQVWPERVLLRAAAQVTRALLPWGRGSRITALEQHLHKTHTHRRSRNVLAWGESMNPLGNAVVFAPVL